MLEIKLMHFSQYIVNLRFLLPQIILLLKVILYPLLLPLTRWARTVTLPRVQ